MQREDLTGRMFGSWLVLGYARDNKWLCECQCELHTRREVLASSLKRNSSTCCGDRKMHPKNGDLSGTQVGELKVIKYVGGSVYTCQCSCGKILNVETKQLKRQAITDCGHVALLKRQKELQEPKQIKPKYKPAGDWTVLGQASENGYYLCRCVCGNEKVMSDSAIYNARKKGYKCNHKIPTGTVINYLKVLGRDNTQPAGKQYKCQCLKCGKIVYYGSYSLLNKQVQSCGCVKATPTYTKEQILSVINKYMVEHDGSKPQPLVLKDLLGLGETATYENIKRYNLEPYLDRYSSVGEKQVAEIFKNTDMVRHDRKILNGLELDIYIPSLKLAVEYNGSFWHSDERKDKLYHQNKTIACARKGIHLIHIFDYEWEDPVKRAKLTNYLNSFINKSEIYYARNLAVHEIDNKVAGDFCDKYHLQNHVNSNINIALTKDNEIMSVMAFSTPRFNQDYQYEITRYCNKDGVGIVGGAEKLFKYFIDNYKPQSILTYTDISKFTGNVYTKLGFKPMADAFTTPNYVWVDSHLTSVLPRYKTQKHKLLASGLGRADQTEDEIMTDLGYTKVYDSGNLKLEWVDK